MTIEMDKVWTGWMTWEQIEPYKEQIIDMELDEMINFHYPDWKISRSYPEQKVKELKEHLSNGNTFFWGAIYEGELLGYHWAYTAPFIDKLRWHSRSTMFVPKARGLGLGKMTQQEDIRKAIEIGCDELVAMYAPWNNSIANVLASQGYEVSRIEVVKKL